MDIYWCKNNCPYYKIGDCEPIRSERNKITTSPSDTELVEIMRNREVYHEICNRSFKIESTKFSREYIKLSEQIDGLIKHVQRANRKEADIKNLEAHVYEMAKEMISTPDWEKNQEQQDIIKNTADYVGQLKVELKTEYLSSEKIKKVYDSIIDSIIFARRIQDRKKHWIKLGITDFKNINNLVEAGNELTQIQRMIYSVNEMQKGILLMAQQLFIVVRPHLANADKICKELEQAVYVFKAQNILSKA